MSTGSTTTTRIRTADTDRGAGASGVEGGGLGCAAFFIFWCETSWITGRGRLAALATDPPTSSRVMLLTTRCHKTDGALV